MKMVLLIKGSTVVSVLIVIALLLLAAMYFLYRQGKKLEKQQAEQSVLMEANTQTVSMLVVDKKKMGINEAVEAGLAEQIKTQTPFYLKLTKVPVVKAKVGPRMMTLMADPKAFDQLPVKRECKVSISGIYIRSVISARGGIPEAPKKKAGFFSRLFKKN